MHMLNLSSNQNDDSHVCDFRTWNKATVIRKLNGSFYLILSLCFSHQWFSTSLVTNYYNYVSRLLTQLAILEVDFFLYFGSTMNNMRFCKVQQVMMQSRDVINIKCRRMLLALKSTRFYRNCFLFYK
jgi:hypothetical protein